MEIIYATIILVERTHGQRASSLSADLFIKEKYLNKHYVTHKFYCVFYLAIFEFLKIS